MLGDTAGRFLVFRKINGVYTGGDYHSTLCSGALITTRLFVLKSRKEAEEAKNRGAAYAK